MLTTKHTFKHIFYLKLFLYLCMKVCVVRADVGEYAQARTQEVFLSVVGRLDGCQASRLLRTRTVTSVTRHGQRAGAGCCPKTTWLLAQALEADAHGDVFATGRGVAEAAASESAMEHAWRLCPRKTWWSLWPCRRRTRLTTSCEQSRFFRWASRLSRAWSRHRRCGNHEQTRTLYVGSMVSIRRSELVASFFLYCIMFDVVFDQSESDNHMHTQMS